MVLIFEGADLAGKTTLATHYLHALRLPSVKIRWDLIDERAETITLAKATVGLLAATQASVILDRSFVSMRCYTAIDPEYVDPLIQALRYVPDLHLVVLTMGAAELHRRYSQSPDEFFSEETLVAVDRRFNDLPRLFATSLDVVHFDVSRSAADQCRQQLDAHLGLHTGPLQAASPMSKR